MRQGQQNRRGRGRGRKPQNPLARSYESNGPDVKIRGTAAHIAEKYMSLARDALASGDTVGAESYLQHAEHYNRIIMAAQAQQQANAQGSHGGEGANGNEYRARGGSEDSEQDDSADVSGLGDGIRASSPRGERSRGNRGGEGRRTNGGSTNTGSNASTHGSDAPMHDGNGADVAEPQAVNGPAPEALN